jgi:hypothetical protein
MVEGYAVRKATPDEAGRRLSHGGAEDAEKERMAE